MRRQRLGGDNARTNAALGGYKKAANTRKSASRAGRAVLAVITPAAAYKAAQGLGRGTGKAANSSSSKGSSSMNAARVLAALSRKESNGRVEKRVVTEIAGRAFNAMDQLGSPGAVTCRSGYEFFQRPFWRARVGPSCSPRREPTKYGANFTIFRRLASWPA
jgi:hypothetical protein